MGTRKEIECKFTLNGCWECISHSTARGGYPKTSINGKTILLSHVIYQRHFGEIPIVN
jgi:hypothetical protein